MKFTTTFIIAITFFINGKSQSADIILTNGKIFTSDTARLYVDAIAIKGNKIIASGTTVQIEKFVGTKTQKIDLKGRIVIPGLNDAHDHLGWLGNVGVGYTYNENDPAGLSKAAVLDSILRLVKIAKPGQWIHGFIGNTVLSDLSMRHSLDSIAPANPVLLMIWWGHGQVVNAKALEAVGISDNAADPVGGWYMRDASNKINSVHQNAQAPFWNTWLISEPLNAIQELRSITDRMMKMGITTIQQMSSVLNGKESFRLFKEANLPLRIRIIAWPQSTAQGRKLSDWIFTNTHPSKYSYVSGIKYVVDGTPLEGNSLMKKPYPNSKWYGRLNYPVDTMKQILKEALNSHRQLMMHITGDSSLAVILSLMKQLDNGQQWKNRRVRIEHNNTPNITSAEVNDIKNLGLLVMHTPKYCMGSPLRSLIEKGIRLGVSPDGTDNPFVDIMMMTTMMSNPNENITREQAVIAYTKNNAFAEFAEKIKGTLTKNMLADLVVLSQDIFTVPANELPATQVLLTMIDGKIVFKRNGF